MTKDELMKAIDSGWTGYRTQVESYGAEVVEQEAHDGWSVKDHVAHIAAWEQYLIALLSGKSPYGAMGVRDFPAGTSFDEINAAIRLVHHDKPYGEVDALSRQTHAEVIQTLDRFTAEDLEKPYVHYQPSAVGLRHANHPVLSWITGTTCEHYPEHRPWIASVVEEVTAASRR